MPGECHCDENEICEVDLFNHQDLYRRCPNSPLPACDPPSRPFSPNRTRRLGRRQAARSETSWRPSSEPRFLVFPSLPLRTLSERSPGSPLVFPADSSRLQIGLKAYDPQRDKVRNSAHVLVRAESDISAILRNDQASPRPATSTAALHLGRCRRCRPVSIKTVLP